ncbi:MAG: hypothetical protein ACPLRT_04940, partial [Thermoproteota archaeon]
QNGSRAQLCAFHGQRRRISIIKSFSSHAPIKVVKTRRIELFNIFRKPLLSFIKLGGTLLSLRLLELC